MKKAQFEMNMYAHIYAFECVRTSMCTWTLEVCRTLQKRLQSVVIDGIYSSRKCIPEGMGRRVKMKISGGS